MPGIGLLNEKPLHASLKQWCARPGDRFEVAVDGFVVDIVRGDLLLEIQTGGFSSIRPKLERLVETRRIRLVHPIAGEKWIVRSSPDDGRAKRRKSPKRGRWEDLFWEVVSIGPLLSHANLSVEVLLIREEESRRYSGKRTWRRKGWRVEERRLLEVVDRRVLQDRADWLTFLPGGLESFTPRDLAEAKGITLDLAQKMAYALRGAGLIDRIGKRGRAHLYRVAIA